MFFYMISIRSHLILFCVISLMLLLHCQNSLHAKEVNAKPLIGIVLNDGGKGGYSDYPWYALRQNYGKVIEENGAIPVYIGFHTLLVEDYLNVLDGLVLTGGDFPTPPEAFTTGIKDKIDSKHYPRTAFELTLIQKAYDRDMPVMAICGGMQDMVAAMGGVLIQDLQKNYQTKIKHRHEDREQLVHGIKVRTDSKLYGIVKTDSYQVNSNHHSGIKTVPSAFIASAKADDGVIEAIEAPGKTFFMGVMWHPEFMLTPQEKALWKSFIQASDAYHLSKVQPKSE